MLVRIAAVLALLTSLTACGAGSPATTTPTPAAALPSVKSATPSPSAAPSSANPVPACLLSIAQVSSVLDGRWTRSVRGGHGCLYRSDRGAIFALVDIGESAGQGLPEARQACVPGVAPVKTGRTGFVCVEMHPTGENVSGNFIARGHLWLTVALVASGASPQPQLTAMIALLNHLRY